MYAPPSSISRFGQFTLELTSGELKKNGLSVKLAPQPSKVLVFLVGRAGQIVTREEIRDHIWSNETFVDFDKGLNFCIKQIRAALRDDADRPTYIETLPRRGYRFIAPLEAAVDKEEVAELREARRLDTNIAVRTAPIAWFKNGRAWVLLAGTASLLLFVYSSFRRVGPVNFPDRGWIVIAAFENRTGEPIFDGTVESALQRELSESRFVSVLPQERIQDALWLMRKDKHTVLEPDIAREVALRDGNTALVLTGRIEKLGHTYLLSASLVDPGNGMVRRSLSEEAADQDAIVTAVRRLALHVRDTVGETETQIANGGQELERATTPSLRALQFYSKGIEFINHIDPEDWIAGQEMFNRAVQEDPEFASAHVYLAHCYANAGKNKEAGAHFEKAFELADRTTDRERYFILGSYYSFKGDSAKAIDAYQVLVQLYPDDFWGVNNLAFELTGANRPDDALPYIIRRAELRPNDLDTNYVAWDVLSEKGSDPERAQLFLDRARALATTKDARQRPGAWTRLQFVIADQYLHQGDMVRGLQELDRVAAKLENALGDSRSLFLDELGNRYFYLGRLRDAERYYRQLSGGALHMELGALAEVRGDEQTFRKELLAQFASGEELGPGTAARLAREGFTAQAEKVLAAPLMAQIQPVSRIQAAHGELMFARGHRREGLSEMTAAWQSLRSSRNDNAVMVAQYLSDALTKSGRTGEAIEVLEEELADKPDPAALNWIAGSELRLFRLYKAVGREQDARAMELKIHQQLSVADADHPMLAALETSDTIAAVH